MLVYVVKASPCKYEQYEQVIVQATSREEALELAKPEFETAKNWVVPWVNQEYKVEEIPATEKLVLAAIQK